MNALSSSPLVIRLLFFIFFPLLIFLGWGYNFYVSSALPNLNGKQYVAGINQEIEISRDDYGVVYIDATTDDDVFFAMGYVHAQDRIWQLELQRRLSQGRLAEVFGEEAVKSDVWMRTLGIYDSALASKKSLSTKAKQSLQAYSNGINAWLAQGYKLPIEFSVFDIGFEKWKIEDSLAWQKMFALNLAGNYQYELLKYVGRQYQSELAFETIFDTKINGYKQNANTALSIRSVGELINLQNHVEQNLNVGGKYVGSNAFVISGKHTKSGYPILANDPHLSIQIPSLWYAVSQSGDLLKSQGFSLVGLPVVIFGKNENIAWGGTSMMADVQDLVVESTNSDNPEQYLHKQEWHSFEKKVERVQVKSPFPSFLRAPYKPVEFTVRKTHNGPVISDVVPGFDQAVSLKWVALAEQDKTYESFLRANYASNLAEFRASFVDYVAPALNLFYADNDNNIAMLGVGKIPLRAKGDGTFPQGAIQEGEHWLGYIPYSDMPFKLNPESGFIVNANNVNVNADYPYLISTGFAPAHRANRISALLLDKFENNEKISIEDTFKIMGDEQDMAVHKLLSQLIKLLPETEEQFEALEYLRNWNEVSRAEQVAPSIFYSWVRHIKQSAFPEKQITLWSQKIHNTYMKNIDSMLTEDRLAELLLTDARWCQSNEGLPLIDCHRTLLNSLDKALDELTKLNGNNMGNWQWGELQTTVYTHTPFSNFEAIRSVFERNYASGGSLNTVNVSAGYFDKSKGYVKNFGAGFRQAMELSKSNSSHYLMNSTGQSGQAASAHYDDMVIPFKTLSMHEVDKNKTVNSFKLTLKEQKGKL